MLPRRRDFLNVVGAGVATGILTSLTPLSAVWDTKVKALVFDAFPIFDLRPVFRLAEQLFPAKGADLSSAWRTRQFEYQWLHALSRRYVDFWQATEDSLRFAADLLQIDLTSDKLKKLMGAYLELRTWPDVSPALKSLQGESIRFAFLSNATPNILNAGIRNSGLENVFEHVLSTDKIRTYKPDPRAYQMAIDALAISKEEVVFVAFAGWDAAGAKAFGYPTFWVNRLNSPAERLGVFPDGVGKDLNDLVDFVKIRR